MGFYCKKVISMEENAGSLNMLRIRKHKIIGKRCRTGENRKLVSCLTDDCFKDETEVREKRDLVPPYDKVDVFTGD